MQTDDQTRRKLDAELRLQADPVLLELARALDELLRAEWMVTHDWGGDRNAVLDRARAALARARGE